MQLLGCFRAFTLEVVTGLHLLFLSLYLLEVHLRLELWLKLLLRWFVVDWTSIGHNHASRLRGAWKLPHLSPRTEGQVLRLLVESNESAGLTNRRFACTHNLTYSAHVC